MENKIIEKASKEDIEIMSKVRVILKKGRDVDIRKRPNGEIAVYEVIRRDAMK